jgi:Domain of unknown function (DUF6048)
MRLGLPHCSFAKSALLCLSILLGVRGATSAAPLGKNTQREKMDRHDVRKHVSKAEKDKQSPKKLRSITPDTQSLPLKKPKVLEPVKITPDDLWMRLEALVVRRHIAQAPYVPLLQTIGVAVDYGRLAMNLFTKDTRGYAGGLRIVFRKNIQLSGTLGYQKLTQARGMGNKEGYTAVGCYGNVGLDYFVFYNPRNNLYMGLGYGKSRFENRTMPRSSNEQGISKTLAASWWALNIGSEYQLFSDFGFYIGIIGHLRGLGRFEKFEPATNYVVPGYGRNVQNVAPSITLYLKYQISFLEKQVTLS